MARKVEMERNGVIKSAYEGFSWTTLFFSAWVPLIRGDFKWFGIMIGTSILFGVVSGLLQAGEGFISIIGLIVSVSFAFIYNEKHMSELVSKGYRPLYGTEPIGEETKEEVKEIKKVEEETMKLDGESQPKE